MDQNLHDIDNLFREPVEGYTEMPSDKVWQGIDQHLDKTTATSIQRKYRNLKRIAAILVLLLCTGIGYEIYVKTKAVKEVAETTPAKEVNDPGNNSQPENRSLKTNNPEKTVAPGDNNASPAGNEVINEKKKEKPSKESPVKISAIPSASGELVKTVPASLKNKKEAAGTFNKNENNNGTNAGFVRNGTPIQKTAAVAASSSQKNSVARNNKTRNAGNKQQTTSVNIETSSAAIQKNNPVTTVTSEQRSKALISFSSSTARVSSLQNDSTISFSSIRQYQNLLHTAAPTVRSTAKKLHISITPYISPLFSATRIENEEHHAGPRNPREEISEDETHATTFSAGIKAEIPFNNKLSLQTGIAFMQSHTTVAPKKLYADHDNNGQVRYRYECSSGYAYINPKAGAPVAVGDSITSQGGINELKYISIPVALGYTFSAGRFRIIPSAGGMVNFLASQKIETEFDQNISTIEGGKKTFTSIEGLKKTYFNAIADVAFEYGISNKLSLSLTPSTNFALSSINQNASVRSYQNTFGIKAGVKIKL